MCDQPLRVQPTKEKHQLRPKGCLKKSGKVLMTIRPSSLWGLHVADTRLADVLSATQ